MIDQETMLAIAAAADKRRVERRRFMKLAGAATAATAGMSLLAACDDDADDDGSNPPVGSTPVQTGGAITDADVFNFALNLEYLEANYYLFAATGSGLPAGLMTGTGRQGAVTGGRKVGFSDPLLASYAREIAADELAHVTFIRNQLGSAAAAMPDINIDGSATGAFTAAARAAGAVASTATFDPYSSDANFLLGGMLLTDVGVTAYKGSATLIANKTFLEAAAGILAVEAYHSGLLRTSLYRMGLADSMVFTTAQRISDARDSLDGGTSMAGPPQIYADDDQGLQGADATISNIVPSDANGIIFGRAATSVLNIVYLNRSQQTAGGFFPAGLNGTIRQSAANG